jgi:WD40 repeat protein
MKSMHGQSYRHAGFRTALQLARFAVALLMALVAAAERAAAVAPDPEARSPMSSDGALLRLQAQVPAGRLLRIDEGFVTDVAFSPDGATVAAGYGLGPERGGGVMLWNVAARTRVVKKGFPVAEGTITSLAFSPDAKNLAAAYGYSHHHYSETGVIVWDLASRERLLLARLPAKEGWIRSVALSPDGKTLAAGFNLGRRVGAGVVFWDLASRQVTGEKSLPPSEGLLTQVAFSPSGRLLAVGIARAGDPHDGAVALFELAARGRFMQASLRVPEGEVNSVAFCPYGERLAAAYGKRNGGVVLWNLTTRERLMKGLLPVGKGVADRVAFSSDGKTLAAAHAGESVIDVVHWDVAEGRRLAQQTLPVPFGLLHSPAFSPDCMTVAMAYRYELGLQRGGGVLLWDVSSIAPAVAASRGLQPGRRGSFAIPGYWEPVDRGATRSFDTQDQ